MRIYRRELPHIHLDDKDYTLCYRLAHSLPRVVIQRLKEEFHAACIELPDPGSKEWSDHHSLIYEQMQSEHLIKYDRYLNQALSGPTYLKKPEIAQIIIESLHFVETQLDYWWIWSYCIMPNHVHLECTLKPGAPDLEMVMKSHKNYTALSCNKQLNRSGQFWQHETFDRLIRDEEDFNRRIWYTLENPVKAGLVKHWQDWPFTYLHPVLRPGYLLDSDSR